MTNALAQHRPLSLDVVPAFSGYRLAFTGGQSFEALATYPTSDAAMSARRAALEAYAKAESLIDGALPSITKKVA